MGENCLKRNSDYNDASARNKCLSFKVQQRYPLDTPPPAHNTRIKTLCQSCTTLCIWPSIYVRMKLNLASIGNNNTAVTLRARIAIVAQCERIIWPELKVEEQQHQDKIFFLTVASCWNDNDLSAVISVVQINSTTRVLFLTCPFVVPMRHGDVIGQRRRRHRQLTVLLLLLTTTIAWW